LIVRVNGSFETIEQITDSACFSVSIVLSL